MLLGLAWAAMHSSLQTWATSVLPDARAAVVSLFAGSLFAGSAVASAVLAGPAGEAGSARSSAGSPSRGAAGAGRRGAARWRMPPDPVSDGVPDRSLSGN